MRRWTASLALTGVAAALSTSCREGGGPPSPAPGEDRGVIAFIGAAADDPLWPVLRASAMRFAAQQGYYRLECRAPSARSSDAQIAFIRTLEGPSLRGVCIHPVDAVAIRTVLDQLRQRGVQVVTMIQPVPGAQVVGHVGWDETEVGRRLAELTSEYLNGRGPFMLLHAGTEDPAWADRYHAFRRSMGREVGLECWAERNCRADPHTARQLLADLAARYPRVVTWVSLGPWPLMDVPSGGRALPPEVRLITVAPDPSVWPYVEAGDCVAAVAFDYREAGLYALQFCEVAARAPETPRSDFLIPLRSLRPANLPSYRSDWEFWATAAPATLPVR